MNSKIKGNRKERQENANQIFWYCIHILVVTSTRQGSTN